MGRASWSTPLFLILLIAGCAAIAPEGTRLAQMNFHQFAESVVATDNPDLAKRFGASRAAVCRRTLDQETGPCVSATAMLFQSPTTPKEPELRLRAAFENWCAGHGGHAKLAIPKGSATGRDATFIASDFGTAVRALAIKQTTGSETSATRPITPVARECPLGSSSVGLITAVVFSGLDENRQYKQSVLTLLYDEKDLIAFSTKARAENTDKSQ